MDNLQISKILHGMMSSFREGIGETPYPIWEELDQATIELYDGAIEMIKSNCYFYTIKTQPEDIHAYWLEWAKIHRPHHNSLIPYEKLSNTEKAKDMLIISIIESLLILQK